MSEAIFIEPIEKTVLIESTDTTLLVEKEEVGITLVEGRQGASGPVGPTGPKGDSGTGASFVWDQASASASWLIAHNLGLYPSVTVVDSTDRVVEGAVNYVDSNTVRVDFNAPFTGQAFLN